MKSSAQRSDAPSLVQVTDEIFQQFQKFVESKDVVVKTRFDTALDELKEAFKESK